MADPSFERVGGFGDADDALDSTVASAGDVSAYRDGYARVSRELAWARAQGFVPSERQLVLALTHTLKVYGAVRGGKSIGGRRPEWLRGRADALRALLRGEMPSESADQ